MRQARESPAPERAPGRPLQRAHLPALLLIKLLLICALLLAARQPGLRRGGGEGRLAPAGRGLQSRRSRRLLAQATEPDIATYSQAVLLPPDGPEQGGGSVLLPGLVPTGEPLGTAADNLQPTSARCCAACREVQECNAFWYCDKEAGCVDATYNLTSPFRGCQLVAQRLTQPGTGRPVLLVPAPAFTGGAPLRVAPQQVPGYGAFPGLGFWYRFDYPCDGAVSQPGSCGLEGGPARWAARCDADPRCGGMVEFPAGRDYPGPGQPVVLLKGDPDGSSPLSIQDANVNLNAVFYRKQKQAPPGGDDASGLSGGAIIGIAAAACCALAAAAAAAVCVVRRRRRRRQSAAQEAQVAQPPSSKTSGASGKADIGLWPGSAGGGSSCPSRSAEAAGCFSRLELAPQAAAAGPAALRWSEASTLSGLLPLGEAISMGALTAGVGRRVPAKPRTVTPPPSAGHSSAPSCTPAPGTVSTVVPPEALPSNQPGQPVMAGGVLAAPTLAGIAGRAAADGPAVLAGSSPRAAAGFPAALLSQLPTYGWQRCLVDQAAIQFVRLPDGSLEELGSGASATVYKVLLNGVEPHAAKVFRIGSDPQAQLCFLEEAGLLRLLRHRCVVGFAGVCVAAGSGIILMELMEGGDLRTRNAELDAHGRRLFSWYQRGRQVALDVATALHYLHTSSYTHFDVKSRNVLLSRDSAKLADVGFTRAMRATHHSIEGPTGTFDYMAPELLNGRKCTPAVDVYSFGALLWELCTGEYPVRGCMRALHVPQECPAEAAELVAACLQEEPSQRPTARQLVETLTRLQ